MSLLSKLLSRLPSPATANHKDLERKISRTINDALASAGLLPKAPANRNERLAIPSGASKPGLPPLLASVESSGSFNSASFTHQGRTLTYRLYVPAKDTAKAQQPAMVMMLHGCTQSAEDFARGTRMNELSREHGFLVVYPEQSAKANGSKCWNWFNPEDQAREAGEPAFLAALTQELVRKYEVDPARVYVAGLSAGGAMAAILANTYPDLYKAVGVHSGLPYRAANSVASAFAAMGGRQSKSGNLRDTNLRPDLPVVPMIVFHGDADSTVAISNGKALIDQALAATRNSSPRPTVWGSTAGRDYSRTSYTTADGAPLAEYWVLHGAGHAWAGGDAAGSYTDAGGPDASAEMVRFFMGVS